MLLGDLAFSELSFPANLAGVEISGITVDSRDVKPGFLFAALPGTTADGTDYAADAVSRGAVAVLLAVQTDIALPADIGVVRATDPRRALSRLAARFYPRQPDHLVAVTGTSGKTSVAEFARQIFGAAGYVAASVGTLGIVTPKGTRPGSLTSPDAVALHLELDRMARDGVTAGAIEASSHGLDQRRLHGLRLVAAGFTNLGRDHLDYHRNETDYLDAKLKLFAEILPEDGTAVVNMDDAHASTVTDLAVRRGQQVISVGQAGNDIVLNTSATDGFGQRIAITGWGRAYDITLPLAGNFQISNALVAAGLAIAAGVDQDVAFASLEGLVGAPGRLEFIGRKANGAMVFVDYAHKPEALAQVLATLRPMTKNRLIVVFGAGGDRDQGKRQLMGREAAKGADVMIVTDDNPRSEDPASIRRAIMAGAPGALEIGDRGRAVAESVRMLEPGDILCVAGKGHETGQIVGAETHPFSDHEAVRAALAGEAA